MDEPASQPAVPDHSCPSCGLPIRIGHAPGPLQCPQCGAQFLPAVELEYQSTEPGPLAVPFPQSNPNEVELSELRIRNISNLRRGAYRSRSWLIITAGVCLVGSAKLVQVTVVAMQGKLYGTAVGDALFALAALILATFVFQKIVALTREIRSSRLQDPIEPPDLSNLRDGSHRWKDLENLSKRDQG